MGFGHKVLQSVHLRTCGLYSERYLGPQVGFLYENERLDSCEEYFAK